MICCAFFLQYILEVQSCKRCRRGFIRGEYDDKCRALCNYLPAEILSRHGTAVAAVSARRMSREALQHCVTNHTPGFRSRDLCGPITASHYCSSALLMSGKNGPSDDDKWRHEYPVTHHVTHT